MRLIRKSLPRKIREGPSTVFRHKMPQIQPGVEKQAALPQSAVALAQKMIIAVEKAAIRQKGVCQFTIGRPVKPFGKQPMRRTRVKTLGLVMRESR